jgi:hypothetical protein
VIAPSAIQPPLSLPFVRRPWQRDNWHFRWGIATDPDQVRDIVFEESYFHWSEQGQVAFLAHREVTPALAETALEITTQPARFVEVAAGGAFGVFLPGVDGAVAGLYVFDPALMQNLRDDLAIGTERASGRCWWSARRSSPRN